MNRIDQKFQALRHEGARAFMPYLCAGDPNPELTSKLLLTLEEAGADLIELGVPFSDPIADGPTVQRASERALTHRISLQQILEMVTSLRPQTDIPIALMSYYNPIFRMGEAAFCKAAQDAGVDGVIVPDLPPEQAQPLLEVAPHYNLATIFLVAPTSPPERMQLNCLGQHRIHLLCFSNWGNRSARNVVRRDRTDDRGTPKTHGQAA